MFFKTGFLIPQLPPPPPPPLSSPSLPPSPSPSLSLLCVTDAITTSGGHFGFVEGPIFLDNVNCTGTEQSILECLSQDAGIHNCGHRQDVGVLCPGKYGTSLFRTALG